MNLVKQIDIYGYKPSLYYNGSKYKTFIGGLATISLYAMLLTIFIISLMKTQGEFQQVLQVFAFVGGIQ